MSNEHRTEQNKLDEFFLDNTAGLFPRFENLENSDGGKTTAPPGKFKYPILTQEPAASDVPMRTYWKTLRAFFRTGKGGGLPMKDGRMSCHPALMAPYLAAPLAGPYPCWINEELQPGEKPLLHASSALIKQKIASFAAGDTEAKELKDNLLRLDLLIKKKFAGLETPQPLQPLLNEVLDELVLQLDLKGSEAEAFLASINQLRKALSGEGTLIPLSPLAPIQILATLTDQQAKQQRETLKQTINPLIGRIRQLLAVEREKDPAAHSASSLETTMDFAGSFLKFEELASMLPTSGSVVMPEERLHRLEQVLQTLEKAESSFFGQKPSVVVAKGLATEGKFDWQSLFPSANLETVVDEKIFEQAGGLFDQKMQAFSTVFAAIRIALLELDDHYQHEVHGDIFAHFTYTDFSESELALCPPFILIVHSTILLQSGLSDFSALLASNRPLKYLALKFDALGHVAAPDKTGKTDPIFRQELGALALAHRDAYVLQSTAADPVRLFDGLREGLENPAPAFFYVLTAKPGRQLPGGGLVWASGAMGGREFPSFSFDSRKGPKWGSRFDIASNPNPEHDWPDEKLLYTAENGDKHSQVIPFTFADFAALDPDFERFFNLVPGAFWTEDLIPLADYLQLPASEAYRKIPFIWLVDVQNNLQKAAVALPLVQTCRERLDYWHSLQENAGIHSFHVEQATEKLSQEFDAQLAQKIAELNQSHALEIEQVRDESTRNAMARLADYLLDLDVLSVASADTTKPATAVPQTSPAEQETPKAEATAEDKAAEAENLISEEAWVETPLCTTCNECTNLNDRIFKYNADKQAYIADAAAGPFADIVKAAESCPVLIIHPGAPLNPNEAGLEGLVKRAAKFN